MRYKEYNVNSVLEKSIALFWDKGYNGCSINEIVKKTGVNRFSLYHEFENKEGILYKSLQLYKTRYCNERLESLELDGDLVTVLSDFYLSFLQESNRILGCYIIHVGTELADSDSRVRDFMDDYLNEIRVSFEKLLSKHGFDVQSSSFRARHLLGLYCTIMSFCLIHTPEEREEYTINGIKLILS